MANFSVKITGADQLVAKMRQAPGVAREQINKAIYSSILTMLRVARTSFYYFPHVKGNYARTGNLMGRYMVQTFGDLVGRLENKAPYALYVHQGTATMQPGRPFMQQAVDGTQAERDQFFGTALNNIVKSMGVG